jgi:hypothetical protein
MESEADHWAQGPGAELEEMRKMCRRESRLHDYR